MSLDCHIFNVCDKVNVLRLEGVVSAGDPGAVVLRAGHLVLAAG